MKREIKFRGKSLQGEWSYGLLNNDFGLPYNINGKIVDTKTTGQYIGLKDKNGNEIYEGDIVSVKCHYRYDGQEIFFETYSGIVTYDVERCAFCIIEEDDTKHLSCFVGDGVESSVTGNIYNNQEPINEE